MPRYIDTTGKANLGIGVCAHCGMKAALADLVPDGNSPGLIVHDTIECRDPIDPWRLAPRPADRLSLDHPRPDLRLYPGPIAVPVLPLQATLSVGDAAGSPLGGGGSVIAIDDPANPLQRSHPWSAVTAYRPGAQVTATNPTGITAAGVEFWQFTCLIGGISGPTPPIWPTRPGIEVFDGTVMWINTGLFLP